MEEKTYIVTVKTNDPENKGDKEKDPISKLNDWEKEYKEYRKQKDSYEKHKELYYEIDNAVSEMNPSELKIFYSFVCEEAKIAEQSHRIIENNKALLMNYLAVTSAILAMQLTVFNINPIIKTIILIIFCVSAIVLLVDIFIYPFLSEKVKFIKKCDNRNKKKLCDCAFYALVGGIIENHLEDS